MSSLVGKGIEPPACSTTSPINSRACCRRAQAE